jgi:hyperosmotically inducible protein
MRKTVLAIAALLLVAPAAGAGEAQRKDFQVFNDIATSVNHDVYFTIFDAISADVENGVVTLSGQVTQPYKRDELEKRIAKVDGVAKIVNRVKVLPVSGFDDQLRHRIARAIYGNANFWNYAIMANPPIHIVVDHGRVTLSGVVQSDVDRMLARSLATMPGVFSVTNELKTVAEMKELGEQS